MDWQYEIGKRKENFFRWVAYRLPRELVYWAAIRVMASATIGSHSNQIVPELTAAQALERWGRSSGK